MTKPILRCVFLAALTVASAASASAGELKLTMQDGRVTIIADNVPLRQILQEWAPRVKEGQDVTIVDDTYQGPTWKGHIEHLAPWFTQKRNMIVEPFNYNDVRYMECVVKVFPEGQYPLRVGQRVRVKIPSQ